MEISKMGTPQRLLQEAAVYGQRDGKLSIQQPITRAEADILRKHWSSTWDWQQVFTRALAKARVIEGVDQWEDEGGALYESDAGL